MRGAFYLMLASVVRSWHDVHIQPNDKASQPKFADYDHGVVELEDRL